MEQIHYGESMLITETVMLNSSAILKTEIKICLNSAEGLVSYGYLEVVF